MGGGNCWTRAARRHRPLHRLQRPRLGAPPEASSPFTRRSWTRSPSPDSDILRKLLALNATGDALSQAGVAAARRRPPPERHVHGAQWSTGSSTRQWAPPPSSASLRSRSEQTALPLSGTCSRAHDCEMPAMFLSKASAKRNIFFSHTGSWNSTRS